MEERVEAEIRNADPEMKKFEDWSRTYDRSPLQKIFFGRVHRSVLGLVPGSFEPAAVLDIGCGTGRLLRAAGRRWPGARLVGVDATPGMIEAARRIDPQSEYHLAPAESQPLASGSIDVVFSTVSFHHWTDQAAGLRETSRVLSPCGRFILADESLPDWGNRIVHGKNGTHPVPAKPAALRLLLEAAGFHVMQTKRVAYRVVIVFVAVHKESPDPAFFE